MLFSVIVPVYNVEQYLEECLNSIVEQTYSDFEVILIDDGSTDQSGKICDRFAENDQRFKVLHKANGGQASARNRGVEIACGQYVFFIDSDDAIADKMAFEWLAKELESSPDIVAYHYRKWFPDRVTDMSISFAGIPDGDKIEIVRELIKRDGFFCSCWSKIVKLSLLREYEIAFDESSKCEDMDWYFQVIAKAQSIKLLDKPLILYRQREGSVTKQSGEKGFQDNITVIEKWEKIFASSPDPRWKETMLSALAKLYCNLLISFSNSYKTLKKYSRQILAYKHLLRYDLNPRTKTIRKISGIVGLRMTCQLLRLAARLR